MGLCLVGRASECHVVSGPPGVLGMGVLGTDMGGAPAVGPAGAMPSAVPSALERGSRATRAALGSVAATMPEALPGE